MKIVPIPAFRDNYIWALFGSADQVVLVDPGDSEPAEMFLLQHQLTLSGILITHHHADHTGGIRNLTQHRNIPVYGPAGDHIKGITHPVHEADQITIFEHCIKVMAVPGHTLDHIAYFIEDFKDGSAPALFCGDTLFAAGCGRLFEGTAEMMYTSLRRLAALPETTRVYCAHEYTLGNLRFAKLAEPLNTALTERLALESAKREQGLPTLPSTILLEQRTNPFLRCHTVNLQTQLAAHMAQSLHSEIETFALLRRWKDQA